MVTRYSGAGCVTVRMKKSLIHNGEVLAAAGEKVSMTSLEAERAVREGRAEYPRN